MIVVIYNCSLIYLGNSWQLKVKVIERYNINSIYTIKFKILIDSYLYYKANLNQKKKGRKNYVETVYLRSGTCWPGGT